MRFSQNKYFLFIFLSFSNAWANHEEAGRDLTGYEQSYFVYADDGVDEHVEFKISVKYPLDKEVSWLNNLLGGDNKVYFAYTGKFDFFIFSDEGIGRDSAPVVSRIQNPGLFVSHKFNDHGNNDGFESVSVGWFHESNGQQISDNATFTNTVNASDYVSRGWDYLSVDTMYRKNNFWFFDGYVNVYAQLRFICGCQGGGIIDGKEDDIRILGGAETADVRDFDGLRLNVENYANHELQYGVQLRTGFVNESAFDNWSYRLEISYRVKNIPFTLFYFNGYGENISTYHIKNDYIGFGIKMW